ncbi:MULTISPECIES: head completion/stabilization protein [unclassified Acinetobacter]|uniref:head completion/stabilization protein n=1 Tax=unclassified Acinetobacter TaxID=196816 RepID=UPI0022AC10A1|nr:MULTISPECIES: head completion/stabilization protein [unclassified Acinetobacter]WAU72943.1 head completion/stabilization protein [Acinetobacter sp. TR11]WAU76038.1 head completion/stabilization protein [Acinetobacter sp. TR3]
MLLNNSLSETVVQNPREGYPSISVTELLSEVRLDASKGNELLASNIEAAMDTVNNQLIGKHYLVAPLTVDQTRFYKRAVCNEAAAVIAEDNKDFDTSSTGQIRGENGLDKVTSLRRNVNYAIADLTNRKRNRVRLL